MAAEVIKKFGNWTLDDRNFLLKTLDVGGPVIADLSRLCIQGLTPEDLHFYFIDLRKMIQGEKIEFKYYIDKLLALETSQYRFKEDEEDSDLV